MWAAKVQASLRIRAVSPEPSLLAHTSSESRGTFRQKARSLAPLNGWACAVKICHDGMLEDTNSLDAAHLSLNKAIDGRECKKRISLKWLWGADWKFHPLGYLFGITRQASWCQTVTVVIRFSICTSQPLQILILFTFSYLSPVTIKPVFGVFNQVRLKQVCSAKE